MSIFPFAPGIPPLLKKINRVANTAILLVADAVLILKMFAKPVWGIYDKNGKAVIVPDSIVRLEFRRDWMISDYPVENGGFQSYNKVVTPKDVRISMTKGGLDGDREEFLLRVDELARSLDTYNVAMPEGSITSLNIVHYDYRRSSRNGVGLLTVEVWFREINQSATATYTKAKEPGGAGQANGGTVQAQPATPAQAQAAGKAT